MIFDFIFSFIVLLGICVYVLCKIELGRCKPSNRKWYVATSLFGLLLICVSSLMLVGLNVPKNGMIIMDGGIKGHDKIFKNVNDNDDFNLVYVRNVNIENVFHKAYFEFIKSDRNPEFIPKEDSVLSADERRDIGRSLSVESKRKSYIAAYNEAGDPLSYRKYLQVEALLKNQILNTKSGLQKGDIVKKVDGKIIKDRSKFWSYTNSVNGEEIDIEISRNGESKVVSFVPNNYGDNHFKNGFWVSEQFDIEIPEDAPEFHPDFLDLGDSAGLLIAIKLYDEISGNVFGGDEKVVVTGAIEESGSVKPVGSIKHKVSAAIKEGADVFIVPESNALKALLQQQELRGSQMKIIPVKTLTEALDYLKK